jgi:type I restriction enzyme, S subunit
MKPWPKVRLGEVLSKSEEMVNPKPDSEYREITVRLWGKGVVERGRRQGAEMAGNRRFVARQGQFIVSRIDARNGAMGIVPQPLDGALVTNDFPLFNLNRGRLFPDFIGWLCRTNDFVELCQQASEGTTNRVRLKEERFLALEIPLPPLQEQQRIVARIEEVSSLIDEACSLRQQSIVMSEYLWPSILQMKLSGINVSETAGTQKNAKEMLRAAAKMFSGVTPPNHNNAHPHNPQLSDNGPFRLPPTWTWSTIGSVVTHLVDCVNDTPDFADYDTGLIGLKSSNIRPYRLDLSKKWFMTPEDFKQWNRREQPKGGDIVLTREAPMGYACLLPKRADLCLTQRLLLLRPNQHTILPKLLLHYLNSSIFLNQVKDHCRGLTTPHIRVQDAPNFLLPLPPMHTQRELIDELDILQNEFGSFKSAHSETTAEFDVLLPAILDRAFRGELT